ncbi:ABC transporter permease [Candidatus Woesearchaeota archaeon]|nr:ABC transporter permease [Candidatus Woesearchaeota archaeon]
MDNYYFHLMKSFALTDFKLKYQGSVLGYLWSLLNPLLTFAILYVVFSVFVRFQMENYSLFLFLGIILWGYFNEATFNALVSLYTKSNIMKKIYFPRTVIVLASNVTTFLGFLLNFIVFLFFVLFSEIELHFLSFLSILFFINLFLLTLGISYIVAGLNLRFIDTQHIWRILLQLFFWLTPVVYSLQLVPESYRFFFYFNPLVLILEGIRNIFLENIFSFHFYFISLLFSLVVFFSGYFLYRKMSVYFAEWV